ncbi:hypothetical protein BGW37DRAFT_523448 [Umbelopsis sp. PMI_123]|nr:hypothetical protein BGW37DRAFT_523448 [Umbelopsis sp. PMI_123]
MNLAYKLPDDVLRLIFENLTRTDIVNCTYTCWIWNAAANKRLYSKLSVPSKRRLELLIRTIAEPQSTSESENSRTVTKRQQLGSLIHDVTFRIPDRPGANLRWSSSQLSTFANSTPNVHTVYIRDFSIFQRFDVATSWLDWESLDSPWRHLKTLKIASNLRSSSTRAHIYNMEGVLNRLQAVDTIFWSNFLLCLPQPLPVMENLKSLKVAITNKASYEQLKALLPRCRNTLRSLSIRWESTATYNPPLSLDNLMAELPKLKIFTLQFDKHARFTVDSFGDQLECLSLNGLPETMDGDIDDMVGQATEKTSNLKRLHIPDSKRIDNYIPNIIEANKMTLQTVYINSSNGANVISMLMDKKTEATKVTTLGFRLTGDHNKLFELSNIFPGVECLGLIPWANDDKYDKIAADRLSQFRYLKGVDRITLEMLIAPSECKYEKVSLDWFSAWVVCYRNGSPYR